LNAEQIMIDTQDVNQIRRTAVARKLEHGAYLLDAQERLALALAARLVERAEDRRIDLSLPLEEFDYLLLPAARLIVLEDDDAIEAIERAMRECLEKRRRNQD
jgi:hypothetical protein